MGKPGGRATGALVVVVAVAGLVVAPPVAHAAPTSTPSTSTSARRAPLARAVPQVDPNHLFVRFRSRPADVSTHLAQAGAVAPHALPGTAWTTVETPGNALAVRARLERDPTVAQVQLSYIRKASAVADVVPNDPRWASAQRDYLGPLRMDQAWAVSQGSNVKVAVVDTGVDGQHPDLANRVLAGIDETGTSANAQDDNGHGTMVAGIIAADLNNSRGIAGIAPLAKIVPIKVLDANGEGDDVTIAQGIADAVTAGAKVINMSLGGIAFDQGLCDAVASASASAVVVAAAGNDGDNEVEYPAACPGAIAVSATNHTGALTSFSSFGPRVDIAAPGLDITSTVPGPSPSSDTYATGSGTSFSTPIVSGVAALVIAHGSAVSGVPTLLEDTARDAGPPGKDAAFGSGIVDPVAALGGPPMTPMYVTNPGGDEPNNTPSNATTLAINTTHAAAIAPETDEDWYKVNVTSPGWYTVDVPPGNGALDHNMDPIVQLYDSSEHLLASQEFAGGDLTFQITSTGNYYVRVRNRGGDTASYTVRMSSASQPSVFASPLDFPVDSTAQSVGVGDLTGDGRNDVAFLMGDNSSIPDTLVVLDQTPDRSFVIGDVVSTPFLSTPGTGLVVADATGDGFADVVFPTSSGVAVSTQSGGHLGAVTQPINEPGVNHVAVADLDGDGKPDIITSSNNGLKVWWGPSFGAPTTISNTKASSISADGTHLVARAGTTVTEYSFSGRSTPAAASATVNGAINVTIDHASSQMVVSQQIAGQANGKLVVLSNGGSTLNVVRTINLNEPNPDPVATASIGGVASIVTLHDITGDVGVVPLTGGSESLFAGDDEAMSHYDSNAFAVRDIDGDGAPDITIGTLFGITMLMHRLDALPENYGQTLLHAASPLSLSTGNATTVAPSLTLNQASVNAGTQLQLLNAQNTPVSLSSTPSNGTTVTLTPASPLTSGAAYSLDADGLADSSGDTIEGFPTGFVVGAPVNTDVSVQSPPSGFVPTANVSISFTSHDPSATFMCSLDSANYTACTSPQPETVAAGAHTFRVFARNTIIPQDSAPAVVTWTYRPPPHGYWMVGAHGTVYPFGSVPGLGSAATSNAVDMDASPTGFGYWVADASGHVFAFGDAKWHGNATALQSGESVTSVSRTKSGNGYWLFTSKGRVFPFGDAHFFGDMSGKALNAPVLDSVTTSSGNGYYMVAADGGVFTFGDAKFYGSTGSMRLNAPVRTMVVNPTGIGYWLIASDGGVFSFKAPFRGSMGGKPLNRPIVGGVAFGNGYLMVGSDGGIFDFSNKPFFGSLGGNPPAIPIVSVAAFA